MADMTEGERIAEERIKEAARTGQDWLDLGGLGLTRLPQAISKLTGLQRLTLGGLFGLSDNQFRLRDTDEINPLSDLSAVSFLTNLRELYIESTQCADLAPLRPLEHLRKLDCWNTPVSVLDPIENLNQLEELDCTSTLIDDIEPLKGLSRLKSLNCGHTKIADLTPLAGLMDLERLTCQKTLIHDLTPLTNLRNLKFLDCEDTRVRDLAPISELVNLRELNVRNTKVRSLSPLLHLKEMRFLNLRATSVTDLTPVAAMQLLEHLDCSHSNVSDLTPLIGLPHLKKLNCDTTLVSDLSPLSSMPELQFFDCDNTLVDDLISLTNIPSLLYISAENCRISTLPASVSRLQVLRMLNLRRNRLQTLPRELGQIVSLHFAAKEADPRDQHRGLFLGGNQLVPPFPDLIAPGQPQATINVLRWLRGESIESEAKEPDPPTPVEDAGDPPAIPEQGAGPRVILDQTGRLVFARPSDLDANGNDRNRLEALHPALREAAAELTKVLQDHPSNLRNERLLQKAEAYRALVDLPLDEVNFARLYGAGMQLLNAAAATRRALEAGRVDVPELAPVQDECLANIENLHPPFVLASRDGQEMLADQTTIKLTAEAVEGIKEAGTELGAELINHPDLADREVGETIRDAAAEIGQGENEARDAVNTVSTMRNAVIVLTTASKWAIIPTAVGFAAGGPPGAIAAGGATLWWYGAKVAEKTKAFQADADRAAKALDAEAEKLPIIRNRMARHQRLLLKVEPKLRRITQLPGFTWLGPSLDWLKRNSPPDKKE
ncbi:MAG: leucine-rich repeat domain-containing protein [Roseomonas sp.]|nr:leucine-rich repeat domain-containing protein [Roseomonas sp.]